MRSVYCSTVQTCVCIEFWGVFDGEVALFLCVIYQAALDNQWNIQKICRSRFQAHYFHLYAHRKSWHTYCVLWHLEGKRNSVSRWYSGIWSLTSFSVVDRKVYPCSFAAALAVSSFNCSLAHPCANVKASSTCISGFDLQDSSFFNHLQISCAWRWVSRITVLYNMHAELLIHEWSIIWS